VTAITGRSDRIPFIGFAESWKRERNCFEACKKTRLHVFRVQARQIKEVLAMDAGFVIAPGLIGKIKPL
jgi:hypothetical protein